MEKNPKTPEQCQTVMPYLIIENAEAFIQFMKDVFDAPLNYKEMRSENIIRHGQVMVGESMIMFADKTDAIDARTAGLFVYVDNADDRYNKAIGAGAKKIMELSDQPYGRTGGVLDPFGNTWWITAPL
jgi:PhnB protein